MASSSSSSSVCFKNVEIREYCITIGDNPSCTSGCPISLGWEYNENLQALPLDFFEANRVGRRRQIHQMKMPANMRYDTLRDWNVSTRDILVAQKQCEEVKKQRMNTLRKEQRRESMKCFFGRMPSLKPAAAFLVPPEKGRRDRNDMNVHRQSKESFQIKRHTRIK